MITKLNVFDGFKNLRVEKRLPKQVEAKAPSTVLTSLIHNLGEQAIVHVISEPFTWAVRTGKVAGCGGFDEQVSWVGIVNPGLGSEFVEAFRQHFEPWGDSRGIHYILIWLEATVQKKRVYLGFHACAKNRIPLGEKYHAL